MQRPGGRKQHDGFGELKEVQWVKRAVGPGQAEEERTDPKELEGCCEEHRLYFRAPWGGASWEGYEQEGTSV